jgi:hypothetical protein
VIVLVAPDGTLLCEMRKYLPDIKLLTDPTPDRRHYRAVLGRDNFTLDKLVWDKEIAVLCVSRTFAVIVIGRHGLGLFGEYRFQVFAHSILSGLLEPALHSQSLSQSINIPGSLMMPLKFNAAGLLKLQRCKPCPRSEKFEQPVLFFFYFLTLFGCEFEGTARIIGKRDRFSGY